LPKKERREEEKKEKERKKENGGVGSGGDKTSVEDWKRQGQLQKTLKTSAR